VSVEKELLRLKRDAFDAAKDGHEVIKFEQSVYRNQAAYAGTPKVGPVASVSAEELYPKTTETINKLAPRIEDAAVRIEIQPDRSSKTEDEIRLVKEIQNWVDMYEQVDGEGEQLRMAIHHFLVGGMAIRKTRWNAVQQRVECCTISPLSFASDPDGHRIDLLDSGHVWQTNSASRYHVKRYYPQYELQPERNGASVTYCIDEGWLRRSLAEDIGIDVSETKKQIVRAVMINDKLARVHPSPWIYPDFPFSCWRNFRNYTDSGQPESFWGFGFASLLWPQQKILDHLLAAVVVLTNHETVRWYLTKFGAIDRAKLPAFHDIVELIEGYNIGDVTQLNPTQIIAILFQFVGFILQAMEGMTVGPVFSGESPSTAMSGRAIAGLQSAAYAQVGGIVRSENEFRARSVRQKAVMVQQLAKKPVSLNLWRGGIDLMDEFPDDARHIGFAVNVPDATGLPTTAAGKLQLVEFLLKAGLPLSLNKLLELTGLDVGYGIRPEDFQMPPMGAGAPVAEDVLSGREVAPEEV
jgi:hypothetical protein